MRPKRFLTGLIVLFLLLWLASLAYAFFGAHSLEQAAALGESFGGISALFSGFALALAIYSMVLQQKQSAYFERVTLQSMQQQTDLLEKLEKALLQQSKVAQVAAMTAMIDRLELRIQNLKSWGTIKGDENYYRNGIDAAIAKIKTYEQKIAEIEE